MEIIISLIHFKNTKQICAVSSTALTKRVLIICMLFVPPSNNKGLLLQLVLSIIEGSI